MKIELNGEARDVENGQLLSELVTALSLSNQAIAVAVNRQIIVRSMWNEHVLKMNDKVDVVRAIGGG
ncbi:sulfur carrier protein ThiS [Undibacterium sp.]|uniref:sulfur carrier protein ThiS n=1 Tax=Undibacterium sp. TaxID=1914977 RepID=UPI00374CA448